MNLAQQLEFRTYLAQLMEIAGRLGSDRTEGELLEHVGKMEFWLNKQFDLEVSKAIQPFVKIDTTLRKRRPLK